MTTIFCIFGFCFILLVFIMIIDEAASKQYEPMNEDEERKFLSEYDLPEEEIKKIIALPWRHK